MIETLFSLVILGAWLFKQNDSMLIASGLFAIAANLGLLHEDFRR